MKETISLENVGIISLTLIVSILIADTLIKNMAREKMRRGGSLLNSRGTYPPAPQNANAAAQQAAANVAQAQAIVNTPNALPAAQAVTSVTDNFLTSAAPSYGN